MLDDLVCPPIPAAASTAPSGSRSAPTTTSTLVRGTAVQLIETTTSRRMRRAHDFLSAVRSMVSRRLHPKAGLTTLRLAEVFVAQRMRRSGEGHFLFGDDITARQLGLSRRTVMHHAQYLRELDTLACVERGSKAAACRRTG